MSVGSLYTSNIYINGVRYGKKTIILFDQYGSLVGSEEVLGPV
jgi:hypothetical protein